VQQTYTNIQRWTEIEEGGHFAAMEQPVTLAREVQEFFRTLR
jgi:microsomal epoxide hydrolase